MNSEGTLRLFAALEISEETRLGLAKLQHELGRLPVAVRWVDPALIHLTLVFLGDTPAELADIAGESLTTIAAQCAPFEFNIAGAGFFGNSRSPRVIWAGVREERGALDRLQGAFTAELRALGWQLEDGPYKPHLTIGRVKAPRNAHLIPTALQRWSDIVLGNMTAREVLLVESNLTPDGPVYNVRQRSVIGHP